MCGFLLRAIFLSVVLYLLLGIESVVHVVTLGGQILGATLAGLLTSCYHTGSKFFFINIGLGRIFATMMSGLTTMFVVHVLPGYTIVSFTLFLYTVVFFCIIGWLANYFIEDK